MKERIEEKIKSLIEQRVIEATKKQMTQKLIAISKTLGKKIISHSVFDDKLKDPWRLQEEEDFIYDPIRPDEIRDADEWTTTDLGYYFDGLRCGINLCITAMFYDDKVSELKVTYNGYVVFAEMDGELKAYAPFARWEDAVEMFYEASVEIEKKRREEQKKKREIENKERINGFWQRFRMLWGF